AHAQLQRGGGLLQRRSDRLRGPVGQRGKPIAGVGQRRAGGRAEVLGDRLPVVVGQRPVPRGGTLGHFLQRVHTVAQRHHDIRRRRSRGKVVAGRAQVPLQVLRDVFRGVALQVLL